MLERPDLFDIIAGMGLFFYFVFLYYLFFDK